MFEPDKTPDDKTDSARMWALASRYSAVGIEMAAGVGVGAWAGNWLDGRFNSGPWGLLAGFAVGLGAAVKAVARVIRMRRADGL
jgi:ATP synthase protein I